MSLRDKITKCLHEHEHRTLFEIAACVQEIGTRGLIKLKESQYAPVANELQRMQDDGLVVRCDPPKGPYVYYPSLRSQLRQSDCDV